MLLFNPQSLNATIQLPLNLNTSHVIVQLKNSLPEMTTVYDLNTSHVIVQPPSFSRYGINKPI